MPDTTINPSINPLQPGSYSVVDASALIDAERPTLRPVPAIIGTCLGGKPNTALYFRGPGPLIAAKWCPHKMYLFVGT